MKLILKDGDKIVLEREIKKEQIETISICRYKSDYFYYTATKNLAALDTAFFVKVLPPLDISE